MQWLKRTIRWQLWDRAGELRLAPFTVRAITRLTFQVRAIGRQLNQAVHAMHAANQPGSGLAIDRIAGDVIAMEGRVLAVNAIGANFDEAFGRAYGAIAQIKFHDCYYRNDIGHRVRGNRFALQR